VGPWRSRTVRGTLDPVSNAAVELVNDDEIRLRRANVRFPVEIRPDGFVVDDRSTWPQAEGRLEYVEGRLLYMPPCADIQQYVATDVTFILRSWAGSHPELVVGSNEAGMQLGGSVRAADAAVWRRSEVGTASGHVQHVAPVLAVEVSGIDEEEDVLREKARWYRAHGVAAVWLVLPETRQVVIIDESGESRFGVGQALPAHPDLPGLTPPVATFFTQI
jgi:Uma2 family endonuclease